MWYLLVRERVFFLLWVADIMKLRPESCSLKKGRLDKTAEAFDTYVVLKVQNLKGTTIKRRGSEPCWEQDFMFEIGADEKGFTVELWKKGLLWDGILGILWIPLSSVEHATDEGPGAWWTLHSEVIKNGIEIQGTRTPTSHELLLDVYFAIPFDMHEDLDYRGCNKEMLLQGTKHSHKDECDNLSSVESGLHIQENKLRKNKYQTGSNFAQAIWARAIQKTLQDATRRRVRFYKTDKRPSGFCF
ncbi:protein unc-13 homolog A-like isoform X2 [Numida meleagris]|uniref:protein unc-13 homolog A-like isoform X2 n=2 Tax=Numida meleagris TaxID=8996 RepID=UPI000B3DAC3D|nr:protein unc-13 homolog A-like isoform X2 [Numida meleagris]